MSRLFAILLLAAIFAAASAQYIYGGYYGAGYAGYPAYAGGYYAGGLGGYATYGGLGYGLGYYKK